MSWAENYFGIKGYVNLSVFNNLGATADQTHAHDPFFFFFFGLFWLSETLERKSTTNPSESSGGLAFTERVFFFNKRGNVLCFFHRANFERDQVSSCSNYSGGQKWKLTSGGSALIVLFCCPPRRSRLTHYSGRYYEAHEGSLDTVTTEETHQQWNVTTVSNRHNTHLPLSIISNILEFKCMNINLH